MVHAGAEALALAVRSALRAVDAGEPLGDVVAPPPPPPVVAAPPPLPAAPEQGVEAPVAPVDGAFVQVGVHAALDGYHSGDSRACPWARDVRAGCCAFARR